MFLRDELILFFVRICGKANAPVRNFASEISSRLDHMTADGSVAYFAFV